jgi:hypothetical protein
MNKENPYFKIRYAFHPTWTLKEAAHLLSGYDPDNSDFEITPTSGNRVSTLFHWLQPLQYNGQLNNVDFGWKQLPRFNVEQIFECMKTGGREYDEELFAARQLIWGKKAKPQIDGRVIKIIYRHAAKLMWDKHPSLHIPQVSEHLVGLVDKLNAKYGTALNPNYASDIAGFLKGESPHDKGAPTKNAGIIEAADWNYVIENM